VKTYTVYLIECKTPNHFYVGITGCLGHRMEQHKGKEGSVWTKKHGVKCWQVIARGLAKDEALSVERKVYLIMKEMGFEVRGAYDCSLSGKISPKFKAMYPVRP